MPAPLADPSDVADLWRPLVDTELGRVANLIVKASARLRQQCPFDIDARISLYSTDPESPVALSPDIVADVVAGVVKRFLVNQVGVVSQTQTTGPFSISQSFVNRYDKTGTDVRGSLEVTESDIDQLRPATGTPVPRSIRMRPSDTVFPLGVAGPIDDLALRNRVLERHDAEIPFAILEEQA